MPNAFSIWSAAAGRQVLARMVSGCPRDGYQKLQGQELMELTRTGYLLENVNS